MQLGVELAVQLASPFARLYVLEELGEELVRALAHLVMGGGLR